MNEYPRLAEFNIDICTSLHGTPYVQHTSILAALKDSALAKKFFELFGTQTCPAGGYYPWDVEAVLERMVTGKLIGSQAIWD